MAAQLRINWILPGANLCGGTKSNRQIAEAMARRGHSVRLVCAMPLRDWPSIFRPRRFMRHAVKCWHERNLPHHLIDSSIEVTTVRKPTVSADDVPNADVTIATFWTTREWIESWPPEKGRKAYFIRHHEKLIATSPTKAAATYRLPGLKIVIARWLQKTMAEEYGDSNSVLVPNSVDKSIFKPAPRSRQEVPTVGFMYSAVSWKDSATALDAIRKAQNDLPELQVVSFGATPIPRPLMPRNCRYVLRPTQEQVAELCRRCDCWLVSSTSEGFGMPGLEAAACHCPVVSTRCGGPEDYVTDGMSGFLVPVKDPKAMADALMRVLQQPQSDWSRMSEESFRKAYSFDWDYSAAILEQALMRTIS